MTLSPPPGIAGASVVRRFAEVWFTLAFALVVAAFSLALRLPFNLPSGERAQFVGIHYIYPLIGVGIWSAFALVGQRRRLASTFLVALPCYAIVLVCHFNLKLWIPHINPTRWDSLYWSIDQALHPLVLACFALRRGIAPVVPLQSNFYILGFIMMFYLSFCWHAVRTPEKFRALFLAALFFQGLGALSYLVMPAIGPFIHETGVEPQQTAAQLSMLQAYRANVTGGAAWLAQYGGIAITVGLAAMPSLHAGGSFLFLLFAWRHGKPLVPAYCVLFGFIAVDAIANRWHYLSDLPVGMLLAWCCVVLAERITAVHAAAAEAEDAPAMGLPQPALHSPAA